MIITMSPAKKQDFTTPTIIKDYTQPLFVQDAEYLNSLLKVYSAEEIKGLMHISPRQAYEVYQKIHAFDMDRTPQKQTALAYNGIAYLGLDAKSFTTKDWKFAQDHLIHVTGMYGALRPLDMIKPYRLEAAIKLENDKGADLYDYWTDTITHYLADRLIADDKTWINLSSVEYSNMINKKKLPQGTTIVTPIFKQYTDKGCKQIVVYAKKARGMMSRFIIQNQLKNVQELKSFDIEGYSFSTDLSNTEEWIFVR